MEIWASAWHGEHRHWSATFPAMTWTIRHPLCEAKPNTPRGTGWKFRTTLCRLFPACSQGTGKSNQGRTARAQWARAFLAGCQGMSDLGGAGKGDRTMMDAMWPAAETFAASVKAGETDDQAWAKAVSAAKEGAQATRQMAARRGRSSYLGQRVLGHADPGALLWEFGWKLYGDDEEIRMTLPSRNRKVSLCGLTAMWFRRHERHISQVIRTTPRQ